MAQFCYVTEFIGGGLGRGVLSQIWISCGVEERLAYFDRRLNVFLHFLSFVTGLETKRLGYATINRGEFSKPRLKARSARDCMLRFILGIGVGVYSLFLFILHLQACSSVILDLGVMRGGAKPIIQIIKYESDKINYDFY